MPLLVVYNPVCGDSSAKQLFSDSVIPLLSSSNATIDKVIATEHAGHAGTFVTEFLETVEGPFTIVLGSGDGTLHEIIETLTNTPPKGMRALAPPAKLTFVLVPCGTANALYSSLFPPAEGDDPVEYRLKSLRAFIEKGSTIPLTLAITTVVSPPSVRKPARVAISAVVTSTSLHASILHDSEALRASVPGIDRFKLAAQQNITRWYSASVKLFPTQASGVVHFYDPASKSFIPHPHSSEDDPIVDVTGPFAYFLSTVNVDRLEPKFRIAPHMRDIPPEGPALDVVLVRPERDPSMKMDSEEARGAFSQKLVTVLGGAYDNGAHTLLRYASDGCIVSDGDGPIVVEYIRCGGWEWEPDDIDDRAHLVCADGEIQRIEEGGKAACTAAAPVDDKSGFAVYV